MDTIDNDALVSWRLFSQRLAGPRLQSVGEVVRALGGVQAQDDVWARWAIGLRGRGVTEATVERAVAGGEIVRTWAWRGTLHFVAAEDVRWLTSLLAPRIIARNQRRYRQLELDDETFARSNDVITEVLARGQGLSRSSLAAALEEAGISAAGQRTPYILQRAALDGLIYLGPSRGREPTYVLLSEWIPESAAMSRDEAMARLAQRYFAGHGPATIQDFAWWSGLLMADARTALNSARAALLKVTLDGTELWAARDFDPPAGRAGHLLPPFDEYLLAYKDRTAIVDPAHTIKINAGGGMLKPTILVGGRAVGIWKRTMRRDSIVVTIEPFEPLDRGSRGTLDEAAHQLGEFYHMPVEMLQSQRGNQS